MAFVSRALGAFHLLLGLSLIVAIILWGIWYIAIALKLYRVVPESRPDG